MKKYIIQALFILCLVPALSAQNQMSLLHTFSSPNIYMGGGLAALDFNGDGYDDLAMCNSYTRPGDLYNSGKVLIYWGGPGFNYEPDCEILGEHPGHIQRLYNAGDMNGDGCEDLLVDGFAANPDTLSQDVSFDPQLTIYYGGDIPTASPAFIKVFRPNTYDSILVTPLGDVNGDGFSDLGYALRYDYDAIYGNKSRFIIIYGNGFSEQYLYTAGLASYAALIGGMGDINNDGFDDISIGYVENDSGNNQGHIYGYYGNAEQVYTPAFELPMPLNGYSLYKTIALGDLNNDGFDDFATATADAIRLYYGGVIDPNSWDVEMTPRMIGYNAFNKYLFSGDFNGDGWLDVMGSCFSWSAGQGRASMWMGGPDMNGTADLILSDPNVPNWEMGFGYAIALGDFNDDGYCDAAIGSPGVQDWTLHYVYLYSGNAQLQDTTVTADDHLVAPAKFSFSLSPNPLRSGQALNVKLSGRTISPNPTLQVRLYNLKGQLVKRWDRAATTAKNGSLNLTVPEMAAGMYILSVKYKNQTVNKKMLNLK